MIVIVGLVILIAAAAQPQPLAGQPAPGVPDGAASPPPRIAALNGAAAKGAAEPG
jgi:hypothetical protein